MMYEFLHRYLHSQFKAGTLKDPYIFNKAQQYQMYYAISRLDAEKFAALDFTLNFGISSEVRA